MTSWFSRLRRRLRWRSKRVDVLSDEWMSALGRIDADRRARKQAVIPLRSVVSRVSAALYGADPIGLATDGAPVDEYDPEAETIVMRLADETELVEVERVLDIVHEEFVRWFDPSIAGPRDRYLELAARVHALWNDYLAEG